MSVPQFLPVVVSVSLHKGEFCYCAGISPYKLKNLIKRESAALARLGYSKYDKILMPNVVAHLCRVSGLQIDSSRLAECMGHFSVIK